MINPNLTIADKFKHDKYYTPQDLADRLVKIVYEHIDEEDKNNIIIEPSVGCGSFAIPIKKRFVDNEKVFIDLYPDENFSEVIEMDFLDYNNQNKDCILIGNPPYGKANTLSVKFFKHAINFCKYIAIIQPASQYRNNQQMFEFDLIYSEALGNVEFFNDEGEIKNVRSCFNIFKRPENGLNKKPNLNFKNLKTVELRRGNVPPKGFIAEDYDIAISAWGGNVGKVSPKVGHYVNEIYIKGDPEIIEFIKNHDWKNELESSRTTSFRLSRWRLYEIVGRHFELIEED